MSSEVHALVTACFPLAGGMRLLAFALSNYADPQGEHIFPSKETLARATMQAPRTVQRQIGELRSAGWLQVVRHGAGGRGNAVEYRVNPDWLAAAGVEVGAAYAERRPANPIALTASVEGMGDPIKGDILSPFIEAIKGDKKRIKGDKNDVKGDIAVSPHTLNQIPIPPYPPAGGKTFEKAEAAEAPAIDLLSVDEAFEQIERAYPAKRTHDAHKALRAVRAAWPQGVSASALAGVLADVRSEAASEAWQREGGRWVPNLSTWLRGLRKRPSAIVAPPVAAPAENVSASIAASFAQARPPTPDQRAALRALRDRMVVAA